MGNTSTLVFLFLFNIFLFFNNLHADAASASSSNSLTLSLTRHSKLDVFPSSFIAGRTRITLHEIPDGFVMSISLGTPPQLIKKLFFGTGSDLIWVPCGNQTDPFQCHDCDNPYYKKLNLTTYDPSSSTSSSIVSCLSPFCADIHGKTGHYDTCVAAGCPLFRLLNNTCDRPCPSFEYDYAVGKVTGALTRDTLLLLPDNNSNNIPMNISFGCVRDSYMEPIGLVGFGKGILSFPSQLGFLSKGFAYCLLPFKYSSNPNYSTPLILGDSAISSKDYMHFTPMLQNLLYPNFYYIGFEGITVGGNITIAAPTIMWQFNSTQKGGMIMDTGTSCTHLPDPFYSDVRKAIESMVEYPRAEQTEDDTGFDLCYHMPILKNDSQPYDLPSITFHFLNNVSLELYSRSVFNKVAPPKEGTQPVCLLFQRMDDDEPESYGVFGSYQQEDIEIVYDLENERIGFYPTDCASYGK